MRFIAQKLQSVFVRFKEVAERKKGGLDDDDLEVKEFDLGAVRGIYIKPKHTQVSFNND